MLEQIINSKSKTLAAWGQSPSTRFLFYCFCFLAGVAVISIIDKKFPLVYLYFLSFIILSFIIIFWQNKLARFFIICFLLFVFGAARYLLVFPLYDLSLPEDKTEIVGYVVAEPDVRIDGVRYIVNLQSEIKNLQLSGKIYFKSGLYPRYQYGDKLRINCDLERPEPFEDFRYDMYLARQGVFIVCNSPQIEKIAKERGNFLFRGIYWLKNKTAERVSQLWQEPYASFMAGLLYGYRGGLGELNDAFNRTGITHIIAISGYNISIISVVLLAGMSYLYIPRKKAFWLVVSGIILFVLFTGASPSVMRAGVMGILVLLAKQIGRLSRIFNVLVLTAAVMVLFNPLILLYDAGFQLSFVSTVGLVYLSSVLRFIPRSRSDEESFGGPAVGIKNKLGNSVVKRFLRFLPFNELRVEMIKTLSAIIATFPLILYQFGRLSIVAPVVNILILWLIPFLMLFGFSAVIISFIFYPLGQVIAWIAFVGLKYIVIVVQWFAGLKFAAIDLSVPWWGMTILYFFMIYWVMKTNKMQRKYKQNINKI